MRIQPAQPEDADFLAHTILMAGRAHVAKGIWEVILGGSEQETLGFLSQLAVTGNPHLFHCDCYLIARQGDGTRVGSLGGYDPKVHGYQVLMQAIPEVYRKLNKPLQGLAGASGRASDIMACLPREIDSAWVIDSVATLPGASWQRGCRRFNGGDPEERSRNGVSPCPN